MTTDEGQELFLCRCFVFCSPDTEDIVRFFVSNPKVDAQTATLYVAFRSIKK
jgi:hypothetical protein